MFEAAAAFPLPEIAEPPLPADCTMKGLEYMPLYVEKLRQSRAWARCRRMPQLGYWFMNLWTRTWEGGGSLEDDDDILAGAADCPPDQWPGVRAFLLENFQRCARTGRLYHTTICELVRAAWAKRIAFRAQTSKARAARAAKREAVEAQGELDVTAAETVSSANADPIQPKVSRSSETPPDGPNPAGTIRNDSLSQTTESMSKNKKEHSYAVTPRERGALVGGVRAKLFSEGVEDLREMCGKSDRQCRSIIGRLLKKGGDDCAKVLAAIDDARHFGPIDPVAWLFGAVDTEPTLESVMALFTKEELAEMGEFEEGACEDVEEPLPGNRAMVARTEQGLARCVEA